MKESKVPKESETIAARRAARLHGRFKKARSGLKDYRAWWTNGALEILILLSIAALTFYLVYPFFGKQAPPTSFSGPVIPLLARGIEYFFSIPLSYAIQVVYLFFFIIFPLSFYLFIKEISERKLVSYLALLLVTLPVYPFARTRVNAMFFVEDGPHIVSLALIPITLLSLILFSRRGGGKKPSICRPRLFLGSTYFPIWLFYASNFCVDYCLFRDAFRFS